MTPLTTGSGESAAHRVVVQTGRLSAEGDVARLYVAPGRGVRAGAEGLRLDPGAEVSLEAPLNVFPAASWRRWTRVREVRLRVEVGGAAVVRAARSDGRGIRGIAAETRVTDGFAEFALPLDGFEDGGFLWLEAEAGASGALIVSAEWSVQAPEAFRPGAVAVAIATFNRPAACLAQLRALAVLGERQGAPARIVVVDQGDANVADEEEFAQVAALLGDRLTLVRQANLGGSGGFARAASEALRDEAVRHVLFLDDDAELEPEAILRAARFADFAVDPVMVGGAMYHVDERSTLYVQGERWVPARSWMAPASSAGYDVDFATSGLSDRPALHALYESDYSGWWFCLVPADVFRRIGLPLPLFLKFDDAEFGLRARDAGVATVALPGVAVWHEAWGRKDPTRTWEGFFILRNQIVTGLLHSRRRWGGLLPVRTLLGDAKLLLTLQYAAVRLRHEAIRDVLRGPDALPADIGRAQPAMRELRARYSDGRLVADPGRLLEAARRSSPPSHSRALLPLRAACEGVRHLVRHPRAESRERPDAVVELGAPWWRLSGSDSALVEAPGGSGWVFAQRDLRLTRTFAVRSVRSAFRLATSWARLSRQYRDAAPRLASAASWERVFARESAAPHETP